MTFIAMFFMIVAWGERVLATCEQRGREHNRKTASKVNATEIGAFTWRVRQSFNWKLHNASFFFTRKDLFYVGRRAVLQQRNDALHGQGLEQQPTENLSFCDSRQPFFGQVKPPTYF